MPADLELVVPGAGWVLGAFALVSLIALAVVCGGFAESNPAPAQHDLDAIQRENVELKARQDDLRERAFDLAEQLCWHAERERWTVRPAVAPGHSQMDRRLVPPRRDAGNEAILAWLSEQGAQLEALENEVSPGYAEAGTGQARLRATVGGETVSERDAAALRAASTAPAAR